MYNALNIVYSSYPYRAACGLITPGISLRRSYHYYIYNFQVFSSAQTNVCLDLTKMLLMSCDESQFPSRWSAETCKAIELLNMSRVYPIDSLQLVFMFQLSICDKRY